MEAMEHQTTGRLNQLEKEVSSMGAELHSQSRALGELSAIQTMQGARLDKVGDGVDKLLEHKSNNHTFTPSIVLSLIAGVFVAFLSVSEYVGLQLQGVRGGQDAIVTRQAEDRERNNDAIEAFQGFRAETHYEVARFESFKSTVTMLHETAKKEQAHMDERLHTLDTRVRELEQQLSENTALIEERSLYVQNHNNLRHATDPS